MTTPQIGPSDKLHWPEWHWPTWPVASNPLVQSVVQTNLPLVCGSSLLAPWADPGIAQGWVLSPLLFNLLVDGLIATVGRVAPGVQLFSSPARCPGQFYADDLEPMAESQHDLQVALDAVASWAQKWRFTSGIGPTKSAAMVFGPRRHVPPCSVTLAGAPLPVVFEYPYLGVILSPSLSWTPHAQHLVSRGNRFFAQ